MAAHSMSSKAFDRLPFQEDEGPSSIFWLKRALLRFERWSFKRLDYRSTVKELSALSDRELDDIGIARCDIPSIARQSADMAAASRL